MSQTENSDELFDSFNQWSQRCTICTGWLTYAEMVEIDPKHPWQMVHKDCLYVEEVVDESIEKKISKKRNLEENKESKDKKEIKRLKN